MNVKTYIILLMLGCAAGGLALFFGLSHVNAGPESAAESLNLRKLALRDIRRFEDGFSQWLLLSDLIIGSNETYLLDGANDIQQRLLKLTAQLARPGAFPTSEDLLTLRGFLQRQHERLQTAGTYFADDRDAKMSELLDAMDSESMLAIDALGRLKRQASQEVVSEGETHRQTLAFRNQSAVSLAVVYLAYVTLLWCWISRRISQPLRQLSDEAQTAQAEDREFRFQPFGPTEVHRLTESFARLVGGLERRVSERTEHLHRVNQDLEKAVEQARAADVAKSEFLANMSHEIRTPMTAITGFAENLVETGLMDKANSEQADAIQTILRNGDHLLSLINDILDLSKLESGDLDVNTDSVSPFELTTEVVEQQLEKAAAKNLSLQIEWPKPLPSEIQIDATRLRQILGNLLDNAIKFTEQGGVRVVVSSEQADPKAAAAKLRFAVHDTGVGMAPEHLEKVFQTFNQADTSMSRQFGGAGLGLTISRHLARLLGGDLTVASNPGEGSTFELSIEAAVSANAEWITAPVKNADDAAPSPDVESDTSASTGDGASDATAAKPKTPAKKPAAAKLDCRVLLVEDGPDNQRLISFILKKAGAEVTVCENGQLGFDEAMRCWREETPFDVILMDMQMPVLDGYQATTMLRDEGYERPIIALTAHAMAHDRQRCLDAGCDEYNTKPIDRKKLIELVGEYAAGVLA